MNGKMEENIKEIICEIKSMVMEFIYTLMVIGLKENGKMVSKMG